MYLHLQQIREAQERIRPYVLFTPVVVNDLLSRRIGADVLLKCENLQLGGAFKARGACNAVFSLSPGQADAGVVTHSSGNHAAALARAAQLRGIPAHIVMPNNSRSNKLQAVRQMGITPVLCEPTSEARQASADALCQQTGATLVHPYNHPDVMAGQGTATFEFVQQVTDLDCLVVPVGGGGLLAGALVAGKSLVPRLRVFAAEPAWADDAYRSRQAGSIQFPVRYDTVADGLRTPLGDLTFPIIQRLVDEILLVEEARILPMARDLLRDVHLLVEPSAAVAVAALEQYRHHFAGQRVGVILSGGNIDPSDLEATSPGP